MLEMFFALLIGHALGDFVFQSDWMARFKSRVPSSIYTQWEHETIWPYVLGAHALVHGGIVWAMTGRIEFGVAETILHAAIDFGKSERWYDFHTDQAAHIGCKVVFAGVA